MSESAAQPVDAETKANIRDAMHDEVLLQRLFAATFCAANEEIERERENAVRAENDAQRMLTERDAARRETAEAVARERELCCEANRHANVGWRIAMEAAQREIAELKRFLEETQLERQGYKKERDEAQRALVEAKAGIERLRENIKAEREMHQQTIAGTSMNKLAAIAGRQLSEDRLRLYQAAEARVAALEAALAKVPHLCRTKIIQPIVEATNERDPEHSATECTELGGRCAALGGLPEEAVDSDQGGTPK